MGGGSWFVLKIPRGDTDGLGEDEVTATSGHMRKQTEQRNKQRGESYRYIRWRLSETKVRSRVMLLITGLYWKDRDATQTGGVKPK